MMLREVLVLKQRIAGKEHPNTLKSMNTLVMALEKQRREIYGSREDISRDTGVTGEGSRDGICGRTENHLELGEDTAASREF